MVHCGFFTTFTTVSRPQSSHDPRGPTQKSFSPLPSPRVRPHPHPHQHPAPSFTPNLTITTRTLIPTPLPPSHPNLCVCGTWDRSRPATGFTNLGSGPDWARGLGPGPGPRPRGLGPGSGPKFLGSGPARDRSYFWPRGPGPGPCFLYCSLDGSRCFPVLLPVLFPVLFPVVLTVLSPMWFPMLFPILVPDQGSLQQTTPANLPRILRNRGLIVCFSKNTHSFKHVTFFNTKGFTPPLASTRTHTEDIQHTGHTTRTT